MFKDSVNSIIEIKDDKLKKCETKRKIKIN